jgi:hypothetical protein
VFSPCGLYRQLGIKWHITSAHVRIVAVVRKKKKQKEPTGPYCRCRKEGILSSSLKSDADSAVRME